MQPFPSNGKSIRGNPAGPLLVSAAVFLLWISLAACSRSETGTREDSAATSPGTQSTRPVSGDAAVSSQFDSSVGVRSRIAAATSRAPCPHTGLWARCTIERRLSQAGFVVKPVEGEKPKRPGFSIPAQVLQLGRSRLEIFVYDDEAAMKRDIAKLDTVTVTPPGMQSPWDTTPMLIRSGNLAAVLLSQNPRQAERVALALTAGAPQPGSPR